MTNEQILKKAIEKAMDNGYAERNFGAFCYLRNEKGTNDYVKELMETSDKFYALIFNHSFAKAFWGYLGMTDMGEGILGHPPAWQYHLQTMVLEKEPLKYISQFLEK